MQPLVSVIIPVYNRLIYLNEAIESVLAQTYRPYEIIVVDDGSTVNVMQKLEPYAGAVTYLREENRGLASARNFGTQRAQGEFFAFLDDDDMFRPEKLERQVTLLRDNPLVGLIYSDEYLIDKSGVMSETSLSRDRFPPLPSGYIARDFFQDSFIGVMSVLVRRSIFEEMDGFDESLLYNEDDDLWFRILLKYPVICSEYVSGVRRLHDTNMSRDRTSMVYYQLDCIQKYIRCYPEFCLNNADAVKQRVRSLLNGYLIWNLKCHKLPSLRLLLKYRLANKQLQELWLSGC